MRSRLKPELGVALVAGVAIASLAGAGETSRRPPRMPLSIEYDRQLSSRDKEQSIRSTLTLFRELDIDVEYSAEALERVLSVAAGHLGGSPVEDPDLIYDAVYYLTDLVRLPPELHALYRKVLVVDRLKAFDAHSGGLRRRPAAFDNSTRTLLVDHAHLNQLEYFGDFVHPKINFAMLLEVALEARLERLGPEAVSELGLAALVQDDQWVRLNSAADGGWAAYNARWKAHAWPGSASTTVARALDSAIALKNAGESTPSGSESHSDRLLPVGSCVPSTTNPPYRQGLAAS